MSDVIDQANERAEQFLNHSIHSVKKPSVPEATGECFNCGDIILNDVRWCDADCRNDWELRNRELK